MHLKETIIKTLHNEVKPAMGCTEPVAVALAAAAAASHRKELTLERITVKVSPNIFKNGLGVGIPNSQYIGLDVAAALGAVGGNPNAGLKVLESIQPKDEKEALRLIKDGRVEVRVADTELKIHIAVEVLSRDETIQVIIENKHDQIVSVMKNGQLLHSGETAEKSASYNPELIYKTPVKTLIETIETMDYQVLLFLDEGIDMNMTMAEAGLKNTAGIGVGSKLMKSVEEGLLSNDLMTEAMIFTAAASDARMSGLSIPVMSSNGSGNNGLTAILPIAAYCRRFEVPVERRVKALAISHIINCYIKHKIGRLSALCGCSVAAATGATAALSWLMGNRYECIEGAMKDMIADVSGTICDGAKLGCALKLSTAASVAVKYAILAQHNGIVPQKNGIIAATIEETIENLGRLSNEGMRITDHVIFDIMREMNEEQSLTA